MTGDPRTAKEQDLRFELVLVACLNIILLSSIFEFNVLWRCVSVTQYCVMFNSCYS